MELFVRNYETACQIIGSHPHRSNKKDLGKSQSLFYGAPDEGLRCEAEKGD